MPHAQATPTVANSHFTAAFELWETRYRNEPAGFLTHEETAALAVATVSEGRAIYFGALLRETTAAPALTIGTHHPALGGTVGAILSNPDGSTYALIVADAEHELTGAWGEYGQDLPGAKGQSGATNTAAMAAAHSPIATSVQALAIAGHSDWHIPSRLESVALFQHSADLFGKDDWYWTSSQYSRSVAFVQFFEYGYSLNGGKGGEYRVRPVRPIQLQPFTPSPLVAAGDPRDFLAAQQQPEAAAAATEVAA